MKKTLFYSGIIFILIFALLTVNIVMAEPGDDSDPVISLSYIQNTVIPELKAYVDEKFSSVSNGASSGGEASAFKVVELKKGEKLIANAGCEIILRMGSATVIATEKGGLADTTAGYDLPNLTPMPSNHLLIVPLGDGRGFVADTDVIVMVKGGYNVI